MSTKQDRVWVRTCQECGYRQTMKSPAEQTTEQWKDAKCRKCKSPALDYGSDFWTHSVIDGKLVRLEEEEKE